MQEFYCAFKEIEQNRKKVLILILLEDLNLDEAELDQNQLAVLQQYRRTYTSLDAKKYVDDIEKLRKRIIFELPAIPLSKRLIIMQTNGDDMNDNDQAHLLRAEANCTATAEPVR